MKNTLKMHRLAILALSASIVLPIAPVFGQETAPPPQAAAPPPVVSVTPPPVVTVSPPPVVTQAPPPRANAVPRQPVARAAPAPARAAPRVAQRPRVAAPARQVAPAPVSAPVATAPAPTPEALPPVTELPVPAPAEPVAIPVETDGAATNSYLPWLIGGALLIAVIAFFALRRRRGADEVYEETAYEAPAIAAAPIAEPTMATPIAEAPAPLFVQPRSEAPAAPAMVEDVSIDEAAPADVAALAADSEPVAGRPWLEFLLRPVRAGTSQDDTIVQFELTVGNTGTVGAKDVKISTWMFAAGAAGESQMERMLIEPPSNATVSEIDIAAGDGTRVDGELSLPKAGHTDSIMPVVVADARYRLPDGSEGRTSASFAVGLPEGEGIAPFQLDRASGLIETVEARLHGEPQRV